MEAHAIPRSSVLAGLTWMGPRVPSSSTYKADSFPAT
jgi:hypothetical protein